jgi:hypothetical protein
MDHVRKLDVFRAQWAECHDAASVVQVQMRDEQAQRRMNRLCTPDELTRDSGCSGTRSNAGEQAEMGAGTGDNALVEEATHKIEWQALGGVCNRVLVNPDPLEH